MISRLNLVQKFIFSSLVSVILAGIFLVQIFNFIFKEYTLKEAEKVTAYAINSAILPRLSSNNDIYEIAKNDRFMKELETNLVNYNNVVSIKLWDINGTILYSSEDSLIGKNFEIEDDLKEALNGNSYSSVSELSESENKHLKPDNGKLIEIYQPVKNNSHQVIGVFEIYKSYNTINNYIIGMSAVVWLIISLGLLLLYLLLYKSIKSAYITLIEQNDKLQKINSELQKSYVDTISSFSSAVDLRDEYTNNHSKRVTEYAIKIGKKLGLSDFRLDMLEKAALLHDIGKIGIPDLILNKNGKLTEEEYAVIKSHPVKGANFIGRIDFLKDIVPFIRHHHERIDGNGYPDSLSSDKIPLESKIIAVADTFDAITTDRPYRKGASVIDAIKELHRVRDTQLDGKIINIFIQVLQEN